MKIENLLKTLDLHGVKHEDADSRCHEFINSNYGYDMIIITGNSERMKEIVSGVIGEYKLQYIVGGPTGTAGYIRIFGWLAQNTGE